MRAFDYTRVERLGDLEVIHELWTPVGGAYNVDGVLRAGVSAWAIMASALTRKAMLTYVDQCWPGMLMDESDLTWLCVPLVSDVSDVWGDDPWSGRRVGPAFEGQDLFWHSFATATTKLLSLQWYLMTMTTTTPLLLLLLRMMMMMMINDVWFNWTSIICKLISWNDLVTAQWYWFILIHICNRQIFLHPSLAIPCHHHGGFRQGFPARPEPSASSWEPGTGGIAGRLETFDRISRLLSYLKFKD